MFRRAVLIFLTAIGLAVIGCESTTTNVNDGFGMDFENDPQADEAQVID